MERKSIQNKLNNACHLFDTGDVQASRILYRDCLEELSEGEHDLYTSALMGLIYVESALGCFEQARKFASKLLKCACDDYETHIFLHQAGMVERMAGMYTEAMDFFLQERKLLRENLSDNQAAISANFYETGYIRMQQALYEKAERDLKYSLKAGCDSGDMECIGYAYRGLGELYTRMGVYERSYGMYKKAIEAFTNANDLFAIKEVENMLKKSD